MFWWVLRRGRLLDCNEMLSVWLCVEYWFIVSFAKIYVQQTSHFGWRAEYLVVSLASWASSSQPFLMKRNVQTERSRNPHTTLLNWTFSFLVLKTVWFSDFEVWLIQKANKENWITYIRQLTMCRNGNFGLVFDWGEIPLTYMIFACHWTS